MYNKIVRFLIPVIAISLSVTSFAQQCPSGKKNKKEGTETFSVMLTSEDYFSLILQKEVSFRDTAAPPKYSLVFNVASSVKFTDSMLASKGTIELLLLNGTTLSVENVSRSNANIGFGNSLFFTAAVPEETIQALTSSPIQTFTVKELLSTSFATKKQKEQPGMFTCLLQAKPKP